MIPEKVYIADKSQLIMHGIDAIIKQNFTDTQILGMNPEPDKILADMDLYEPEVIIIDETIMYKQEFPLIILLSLLYPHMHIIGLTNYGSPLYHKFADSFLSKPSFAPDELPVLLKTVRNNTKRYSFRAAGFDYLFLLGIYVDHVNGEMTDALLPFIPMSITLDTIPVSGQTSVYVFHFMKALYTEMEKYKKNLIRYISHNHGRISYKVSETMKESSESNQEIIEFLLSDEMQCVKSDSDLKRSHFNQDRFEEMLDRHETDQALDLLAEFINENESSDLKILTRDTKKYLRLLGKKMESDFIKAKIQYFVSGIPKDNFEDFKYVYLKIREQVIRCADKEECEREQEVISNVTNYVHKYYSNSLSVKSVAIHCQIQESYLKCLLEKYFQIPFKSYVDQVRVENASDMLKNTEYSVTEISLKAGYANTGYFDQIFKRYTGYTLKQFRENVRQ